MKISDSPTTNTTKIVIPTDEGARLLQLVKAGQIILHIAPAASPEARIWLYEFKRKLGKV